MTLGVLLAAANLDALAPGGGVADDRRDVAATDASPCASETAAAHDLVGVWSRYDAAEVGDPVRFYYFHDNGQGLYRYGRQGRSNTHSFDYRVDGDTLTLRFRKSGQSHRTALAVEHDDAGTRWLRLADDPREPGARYRKMPPVRGFDACSGDLDLDDIAPAERSVATSPIAGRIWIDHRNFATGGAGFHMYQLNAAGIDGRGIGWFHRGDFDDWSTEAFAYQLSPDALKLWFLERGETEHTTLSVDVDDEGRPQLTLHRDPRDFWHTHRYIDGGASFGLAAFSRVLRTTGEHPAAERDLASFSE